MYNTKNMQSLINIIPFDQFVKLFYILCQEFNDSNEEKVYVSGFKGVGGRDEDFSERKVQTHFWRAPTMETRRSLIIENKNYILGKTIQPYLKNMLPSNQIRFAFLKHNFTCKITKWGYKLFRSHKLSCISYNEF